ncbi:MAG TPA: hypothetical protein VHY91_01080 [Pirellulales bacterium]|nr:hypothetical protein [Pirellulales bacterium]
MLEPTVVVCGFILVRRGNADSLRPVHPPDSIMPDAKDYGAVVVWDGIPDDWKFASGASMLLKNAIRLTRAVRYR